MTDKATAVHPESTSSYDRGTAGRARFLGKSRLFEDLPSTVVESVARALRVRRLTRGSFVFLEGEPSAVLSILAEGNVKLVRETDEGKEVILRIVRPGDVFGAAGVWGEKVYPASAIAQTDTVILQLRVPEFTALLATHPELALAIIRMLGTRLREAEARIRELQTEQVERRVAGAILRLANKVGVKTDRGIEIGIPLSRQDLAELAGTTLSTASRILSAWSQQQIVAVGRQRVVILQPHALFAIANNLTDRGAADDRSAVVPDRLVDHRAHRVRSLR